MIKGVHHLIGKMESEFSLAIKRYIYAEFQDFINFTLRDILHKAVKGKKDFLAG